MRLSEKEKQRLKQRYGSWALVTGASSGIGLELAERLAESGFNLVINARNEEQLNAIAQDLASRYKVGVKVVAIDLTERDSVHTLISFCDSLEVGLLVHCAGFGTSGAFIHSTLSEEQNMLDLNCGSALHLTHHFARRFAAQKKGGIILMSSIVAFQGVVHAAHYAATKAYIQSLAEALYIELKPYGVDVLAAAPGPVQSGFGSRADMNMTAALLPTQVGVPILRALGRQSISYPGFLTKVLTYSLKTLPRWGKVRVMKMVMGAMTQHQRSA